MEFKNKFTKESIKFFLKKTVPFFQVLVRLIIMLPVPVLIIWCCRFIYPPYDYSEWKKTPIINIPKGWYVDKDIVTKEIGMPYLKVDNEEEITKNHSGVIYKNYYNHSTGDVNNFTRDLVFIPNNSNGLCSSTKVYVKNIDHYFVDEVTARLFIEENSISCLTQENHTNNFASQWVFVMLYLIIYAWIYIKITRSISYYFKFSGAFYEFISDWLIFEVS